MSQVAGLGQPPVLDRLIGQPRAREMLAGSLAAPVESYLFVGPAGSGKRDAGTGIRGSARMPERR